MRKYLAIAKITKPSLVASENKGGLVEQGSIWVECPELGYTGENLLYCRYGLSIPYFKVKVGDKLWIEPTIGRSERWVFTGFADCGGRYTLTDNNEGLYEHDSGFILQFEKTKAYLQRAKDNLADENMVLGQELKDCLSTVLGSLSDAFDALNTACTAFGAHYHNALANPVTGVPDGASTASFSSAASQCGTTKSDMDTQKGSPVDDEKMLSDFAFTEK